MPPTPNKFREYLGYPPQPPVPVPGLEASTIPNVSDLRKRAKQYAPQEALLPGRQVPRQKRRHPDGQSTISSANPSYFFPLTV